MSTIQIPRRRYIPHPEGQHTGNITETKNEGEVQTAYGTKHRITVRIESDSAVMDDGRPYSLAQWYTLSSHPKSNLTKLRETLLGRKITQDEAETLDTETEFVGKRVGYVVVHREGREGDIFANIDSLWLHNDDESSEDDDSDDVLPF